MGYIINSSRKYTNTIKKSKGPYTKKEGEVVRGSNKTEIDNKIIY